MKTFPDKLSCISFVCLAVILLIPCVNPHWDSPSVHSPSSIELNPSFQIDAPFSLQYILYTSVSWSYLFPLQERASLTNPFLGKFAYNVILYQL